MKFKPGAVMTFESRKNLNAKKMSIITKRNGIGLFFAVILKTGDLKVSYKTVKA